jgi:threonylcarbamoyladenosine tRNA methylthiotransferase MtaB
VKKKMNYFTELHLGQTRAVLFEQSEKKGMMEGYSDNYIKVSVPFNEDWVNKIVNVIL